MSSLVDYGDDSDEDNFRINSKDDNLRKRRQETLSPEDVDLRPKKMLKTSSAEELIDVSPSIASLEALESESLQELDSECDSNLNNNPAGAQEVVVCLGNDQQFSGEECLAGGASQEKEGKNLQRIELSAEAMSNLKVSLREIRVCLCARN